MLPAQVSRSVLGILKKECTVNDNVGENVQYNEAEIRQTEIERRKKV